MKILVSFSGGRSSAYMAWLIANNWGNQHELCFVFANTGKERSETLDFVDRCDRAWGLGIVWVEAVVYEDRRSCGHKVVSSDTASREGEPFEAVIAKYGIPNMNYLHCTRELKANTIKSYMQSIGWEDHLIAQGIRLDEPRRISNRADFTYPLVTAWPTTKPQVIDWWRDQPFDLNLQEHQGNCDGCHKKSLTKLVRLAKESSGTFDWWSSMEEKYGLAGYNEDGRPRRFYRGHRTAKDIVAISQILTPPPLQSSFWSEEDAGCSESCEAWDGMD